MTRAGKLVRHLRHVLAPPEFKGASDAEFLGRFVNDRDQTAFELIVRRYEPMVFGVCRRILRDRHDAEDAFQATFLALARKAGSIRKGAAVAGWLYRVACRVAFEGRAAAVRRGTLLRLDAELEHVPAPRELGAEALWRDMKPILDEEVSELPEKLRVAVVLCYLQGKSYAEAAAELGCPVGTLSGRLARARRLLASRLTRRGFGAGGALLASALWRDTASAAARNALVESTVAAAARVAAGEAAARVVPASVVGLTEGALRAMFLSNVKKTGLLLALAITCLTAAGVSYRALARAQVMPPAATPGGLRAAEAPQPSRLEKAKPSAVERLRQEGEAVSLEFSPDGRVIAGYLWGVPRTRLTVWDAVTGEEIWQLPVDGQGVNSRPFAFSPDGKTVAVATFGFTIICCDAATGKKVRSFPVKVEGGVGPVLLRFSPDGRRLAAALEVDKVVVLDAVTGRREREVGGNHATIFSLGFSPDGKTLALGTLSPSLQLWDVATGKRSLAAELRPRDEFVTAVAFSPDGKALAAGRCNQIALTEVATGRELGCLRAPVGVIDGLAFTPDGKSLVSGSTDGKARVWDLGKQEVTSTLDGGAEGRSVALSPDGRTVAVGTVRQAVLWDLPSPTGARVKEAKLTPADREALWSDLAEKDVPRAHQAIGRALTAPEQTVSLLRERLRPAAALGPKDAERVRRAITGLDSELFADRERAERDLEEFGAGSAAPLRQTLAGNPSPEVRRRAQGLLERLEKRWPASSPETLRTWRAIKVLEHIGTPDARRLLEKMAKGAPGDRLTEEAGASLGRLAKRAAR